MSDSPVGTTPTPPNKKSSVIDHERIASAVKAIRAHAADFDISSECDAILASFDREVTEGVAGCPLPDVWKGPRAALVECLDAIKAKVSEIPAAMQSDATALENFSARTRGTQDDAKTQVQQTAQTLDSLTVK
ncbi:hypothetical protein [Tsukamurella pseudospumae]|uniref:Uncharacterized protein n=1 Tax=Tsukamurella pseudospumae TaxID=239498 RepID=A0A138A8E0_9ACTN|nr:hypothetical protein [Tsukamurella pseudospumae]KXP06738.1 hypothetical protein AXK60_11785 [Tsukamurella pseudospumae]